MQKFKYVITLEEKSAKEAEAKKSALEKLAPELTSEDILSLAKLLKDDPIQKEIAREAMRMKVKK
jgi:hypothetical protein